MKGFTVRLDERLWERFVSTFPAPGDRSHLIRELIKAAIDRAERTKDSDSFEKSTVRNMMSRIFL